MTRANPAWALAAVLAGYVLYSTRDWEVPAEGAIPFGVLWVLGTALGLAVLIATGRRPGASGAIATGAVVGMLLTDATYVYGGGLRDTELYLQAGRQFLDGGPIYLDRLVTERPTNLADFPFLYPPLSLPFFGVLAALPPAVAVAVWTGGLALAALATLRLLGVTGPWALLLLAWPPFLQGIYYGNVAVLLGLLLAVAPWLGASLVVAPIFKLYNGIAALWLVRERRFAAVAAGAAALLVLALATLPLTGLERWAEWMRGLEWFSASQPLVPASLYGFGLWRFLAPILAIALAVVVVALALRTLGRDGLARLGLATVVASPSLYSHGLIVALPSMLQLRPLPFWSALTITAVAPDPGWWWAIGLAVAAWLVPGLRRDPLASRGDLHPLPAGRTIWPAAPATED